MYWARPAVTPSPPPGSCRLWVTSKTTGYAEFAHHRERAHVHDQVVVAEGRAALGHEDALVAGAGDLGDRVAHVARRQELALLDVDGTPGLRGGDEQVGLAAQERRESAARPRRRPPAPRATASWMSVRTGTPRSRLDRAPRMRRPSREARTAVGRDGRPVGLVVRRLEDERHAARGRDVANRRAPAPAACACALDDARARRSGRAGGRRRRRCRVRSRTAFTAIRMIQ